MKRFIKTCLIAGSVCILVGGGISAVAAGLGGNLQDIAPDGVMRWRSMVSDISLDSFSYEGDFDNSFVNGVFNWGETGKEIFSSPDVKKLDIVIRTGNVVFLEDPNVSGVKIFCNRDNSFWNLFQEDDELELKESTGWGRKAGQGLIFTIQVPEGYRFSDVSIKSTHLRHLDREQSDPVVVVNSLSAEELEIEVQAGGVKISRGNVGTLNVKTTAGAVEFSGITSGDINADCRMGAIKLELAGKKEDYNYDIQCEMGAVKVADEGSAALKGQKQTDNGADKNMDLECKTGAIQVEFMNEL